MKDKKIKILFVIGGFPPAACGIGDYTNLLAGKLYRSGFNVEVLTSDYLGTPGSSKGIRISPCVKGWRAADSGKIIAHIKRAAPDIVHFQYPNLEYKKNLAFNILPVLVKKEMKRTKVVETFHDPLATLTFLGQARHAINIAFADGLVFTEPEGYDTLPLFLKWLAGGKNRVIIPISSNIKTVKNSPRARAGLMKKYGIKSGKKILLTFGFLNDAKGYEEIFRIYDEKKHAWIHLGSVDFGEKYQKNFLSKAKSAGVMINFTGYLPENTAARYLGGCDVVVFTFKNGVSSRNGSFLAAKAQGSYIAAFHISKRGYYKEENAYYVAPGDINGLAKAIDFKEHKKYIKPDMVSWKTTAQRHAEFYRGLLKYKTQGE